MQVLKPQIHEVRQEDFPMGQENQLSNSKMNYVLAQQNEKKNSNPFVVPMPHSPTSTVTTCVQNPLKRKEPIVNSGSDN